MVPLREWWEQGETVELALGGVQRRVFLRALGAGPSLTLLHGFPSSSHDWAKVAPLLAGSHALLAPDFLGFGASEKPPEHDYSLHEQADLVEALWAQRGIGQTALVAHDYAVSVTQELLARRAEGAPAVELTSVHLLNGGVYPELHRALPTQLALLDPEQGPALSALLDEALFTSGLAATFAPGYDAAQDAAEIWQATSRDDGHLLAHRLIRYITDRQENAARWTRALEATDVPLGFIWGMLDPISGAHMAKHIRERIPRAPLVALDDVAHWPALEAPERVAAALLGG